MFNLFRRRKRETSPNELNSVVRAAEAEVAEKWLSFVNKVHFKEDVPLADRIDAFAVPVKDFVFARYPVMNRAPAGVFWLILFNAVASSKTHTQAQLNEAVGTLKARHARPT